MNPALAEAERNIKSVAAGREEWGHRGHPSVITDENRAFHGHGVRGKDFIIGANQMHLQDVEKLIRNGASPFHPFSVPLNFKKCGTTRRSPAREED